MITSRLSSALPSFLPTEEELLPVTTESSFTTPSTSSASSPERTYTPITMQAGGSPGETSETASDHSTATVRELAAKVTSLQKQLAETTKELKETKKELEESTKHNRYLEERGDDLADQNYDLTETNPSILTIEVGEGDNVQVLSLSQYIKRCEKIEDANRRLVGRVNALTNDNAILTADNEILTEFAEIGVAALHKQATAISIFKPWTWCRGKVHPMDIPVTQ